MIIAYMFWKMITKDRQSSKKGQRKKMIDFIINPNSRSGAAMGIWVKTRKILDRKGVHYCIHKTEYAGHAKKITEDLTRGYKAKTLVIVGGDGTINEVLNGIDWSCQVILGYLPTGSGNDFARSMGIISDVDHCLDKAVEKIIHPSRFCILDHGMVETKNNDKRRFMVSSGIGFDAAVCHNLLHSTTKKILNRIHLTKLCYIAIGLKQLLLTKPVQGKIKLDDGRQIPIKNTAFVSAHVHPFEGGGFCFAPGADYKDGKLDLCVVSDTGRVHMVPVLLSALLGKHTHMTGVNIYRCREAEISFEEKRAVHADGESCGEQEKIIVSCIPGKVKIII